MDPYQKRNGTIQRPRPISLTEDLAGMHIYEISPEDNETRLYESTLTGIISQPNPPGNLWGDGGGGPGSTEHQSTNGPPPVRRPLPLLRTRLPSACLPCRQGQAPPPVPPRTRVPLRNINTQLSCDFTEPAHKLNRSTTEIDNHVSISCSFSLGEDKGSFL